MKLCYLWEGDTIISPFVSQDLQAADNVFFAIKQGKDYEQYLPSVLALAKDLVKRNPAYDVRSADVARTRESQTRGVDGFKANSITNMR